MNSLLVGLLFFLLTSSSFANSPLVGIVIPVHNRADFLQEAVASIQAQTHENWQLIIADDASTDDTLAIAQNLAKQDSRIIVVHSAQNRGPGPTRNLGIQQLNRENLDYLAFLDSDDTWQPEKLEKQIAHMQEQNLDLSFTAMLRKSTDGVTDIQEISVRRPTLEDLIENCLFVPSSVMINARTVEDLTFHERFFDEDWGMWIRLAADGAVMEGMDEPLTSYRHGHDQITGISRTRMSFYLSWFMISRNQAKLPWSKIGIIFAKKMKNAVMRRVRYRCQGLFRKS